MKKSPTRRTRTTSCSSSAARASLTRMAKRAFHQPDERTRRAARASTPRLIRLRARARSELYERLGVTKRSSDADIKKAYRKLSLRVRGARARARGSRGGAPRRAAAGGEGQEGGGRGAGFPRRLSSARDARPGARAGRPAAVSSFTLARRARLVVPSSLFPRSTTRTSCGSAGRR